jgi:hypothetical protein
MDARPTGMTFELMQPEQILVSYQGTDVLPEEWESYLALLSTLTGLESLRFVIFADGSPPSAAHQKRIASLVRGHSWPVALISSSTALRFVVSAFSLVNRSIRYFTPDHIPDALRHIGCSAEEATKVDRLLQRMRSQ